MQFNFGAFPKRVEFPIARDADAMRDPISLSSCKLHEKIEPKCLKNWEKVMTPFETLTGFVSGKLSYVSFSLLTFDLLDSLLGIMQMSSDSDFASP